VEYNICGRRDGQTKPVTMRHISEQRCQAGSKLHISFIIAAITMLERASAF